MRSGAQITRTPREWIDYQAAERARLGRELAATLRHARETGAEWYRWIADGKPTLTEAEYEARGGKHARRRR